MCIPEQQGHLPQHAVKVEQVVVLEKQLEVVVLENNYQVVVLEKQLPHIQCSFLGVGTLLLFLSDLKGYSYLCKLNEIRFCNIALLVL